MNYQVLARKWRPHNFTEVVGQSHVVDSLRNALQNNRLHHAYLFTGTRGVGKTTLARILAKAINCENLQDFNPCGVCAICKAVDEGRFLDLIEVDAASRTKVEDTRDLLDNVQYAPNQGRYKVYLIDEVHMLSGHSFNALLKTLEEPPQHVKFLLATTDPHKIPVTVLSRCLQFNLKQLLPSQILGQMRFILEQEGIAFETPALKLLARAADGSMRDGLSLLDQAIVFGSGAVSAKEVETMLGTVAQQPVNDLLQALAQADGVKILSIIDELSHLTPDFGDVLQQILQVLHRVALLQVVPSAIDSEFDGEIMASLAKQISPEDIQLYYQIGLLGQKDLDLAPDPRSGFEMVLLRMLAFRPVLIDSVNAAPPVAKTTIAPVVSASVPSIATAPAPLAPPTTRPAYRSGTEWSAMVEAMALTGLVKQLANNCGLESIDDKSCVLSVAPNTFYTDRAKDTLEKELQAYCATSLKLVINVKENINNTPAEKQAQAKDERQLQAVNAIHNDETVQALKTYFDARVDNIEPITGD
ncbi:MAG: DNA polymerase III subunit gamma/tau [Methylococcaceae bacterium]